ncbi:MAG: prolipoprotein diacylglyceryl transferase [Planctomycetota bacterium]|nr:prolipoprotein diacylglyceryl transferase [Planctomycetota bacterium]
MTYGVLLVAACLGGAAAFGLGLCLRGRGDTAAVMGLLPAVVLAAVVGAKLAGLLDARPETLDEAAGLLLARDGHSSWGALVLGIPVLVLLLRRRGIGLRDALDCLPACLLVAYAIGRLGCHFTGDGCYGVATGDGRLGQVFGCSYPTGDVPTRARVWPTPLFEAAYAGLLAIWIFWPRDKHLALAPGRLFGLYLVLHWGGRFAVEFVRRNPELGPLTAAQWFSLTAMLTGSVLLLRRPQPSHALP